MIEEALSGPKERIRWQRWDMLIIHKNVKVLNTSEAALLKDMERHALSWKENTAQTKSGKYSLPVQAHQQRKSLHRDQPGGLSLWIRDPHTVQGVVESPDLAETRNMVQKHESRKNKAC